MSSDRDCNLHVRAIFRNMLEVRHRSGRIAASLLHRGRDGDIIAAIVNVPLAEVSVDHHDNEIRLGSTYFDLEDDTAEAVQAWLDFCAGTGSLDEAQAAIKAANALFAMKQPTTDRKEARG